MLRATPAAHATRWARHLLQQLDRERPHIILGPILLEPVEGDNSYFALATIEQAEWHLEQIKSSDRTLVVQFRAALALSLISQQCVGIVIHDTGDELYMARLCHTILPTEKIDRLRRLIEAERAAEGAIQ